MWNLLTKARSLYKFTISLKNCTYTTRHELEQLRSIFYSNPLYLTKLEYLKALQKDDKLDGFYSDKPVDLLNQEQIYFLFNSDVNYKFNYRLRKQIMSKIQSTFFKCILAKEFYEIDEVEQYLIALNFNEKVFQMSLSEILFCLQVISTFKVGQNQIDQSRMAQILVKLHQKVQNPEDLLILEGHLMQMNIFCKDWISKDWQILRKKLGQTSKQSFNLIYYLINMEQMQFIEITQKQRQTLNAIMKSIISSFKFNYLQQKHLSFILKNYQDFISQLNIQNFTPNAYISYLEFYQKNIPIEIPKHPIPNLVLQKTTTGQFYQILELRVNLKLDDFLSLAKSLPNFFNYSMKAVNAFFKFYKNYKRTQFRQLRSSKIYQTQSIQIPLKAQKKQRSGQIDLNGQFQDAKQKNISQNDGINKSKSTQQKKGIENNVQSQIKYYIQKVAAQKFSSKALLKDNILKQYDFNGIIQFLANLSRHECCSYVFWGKVLSWLQGRILKDFEQKTCQINQQNYVNLLYLVLNKVFKQTQRVRQIVYDQIIKLINNNSVHNFSFIANICKVLYGSKVGENKIWFLIEQKVNSSFNQSAKLSKKYTSEIYNIAINFNSMSKGSAIFWSNMNNYLDENSKRSIVKSKKIQSLALIHFSFKKEVAKAKSN